MSVIVARRRCEIAERRGGPEPVTIDLSVLTAAPCHSRSMPTTKQLLSKVPEVTVFF